MKALPQEMAGENFHIGIIAGSHGGLGVSMHPTCTDLPLAGGTRPSPGDQPAIARRAAFQFHGRRSATLFAGCASLGIRIIHFFLIATAAP
jgi:hypothetical protein